MSHFVLKVLLADIHNRYLRYLNSYTGNKADRDTLGEFVENYRGSPDFNDKTYDPNTEKWWKDVLRTGMKHFTKDKWPEYNKSSRYRDTRKDTSYTNSNLLAFIRQNARGKRIEHREVENE